MIFRIIRNSHNIKTIAYGMMIGDMTMLQDASIHPNAFIIASTIVTT